MNKIDEHDPVEEIVKAINKRARQGQYDYTPERLQEMRAKLHQEAQMGNPEAVPQLRMLNLNRRS